MSWPVASTVNALCGPNSVPVGRLTFWSLIAWATSSMPMPREASARGSTWTRTAYFCPPMTATCATPLIVEILCAICVSPYSSRVQSGRVSEVSAMYRIG